MRRKAANVATKDILPHKVYAITHEGSPLPSKLARFRVTAVITKRIDATGSPHDYKSYVEGRVAESWSCPPCNITLPANEILGEFEQFQELVERKEQEKRQAEAAEQNRVGNAMRLRHLLYTKTNLPMPKVEDSYRRPEVFSRTYSNSIEINQQGITALLAYFEGEDQTSS